MENQDIPTIYLTPQERLFSGSSPDYEPKEGEENKWYIPEGVLLGKITMKQAIEGRSQPKEIRVGSGLAGRLGLLDCQLIIPLVGLNKKTGETCQDPRISEVWDIKKEQRMENLPGRDLTEELYAQSKKAGINLHLRQPEIEKEKETWGKPESKE